MKWSGGGHDNRHTLVTEPAESGAGYEVIMSSAGHVSRGHALALFPSFGWKRTGVRWMVSPRASPGADEKRKAETLQKRNRLRWHLSRLLFSRGRSPR